MSMTEEQRQALIERNKRKWQDPEYRAMMAEAVKRGNLKRRGRKLPEEVKQKIAESVTKSWENPDDPRRTDEEVRARMAAGASKAGKAQRGKKASEQARRNMSEAHKRSVARDPVKYLEQRVAAGHAGKGIPKSEEWKRKHSESHTAKWQDPEFREKTMAGLNAAWDNEERRAEVSARKTEDWQDPEYRQHMVEAESKTISQKIIAGEWHEYPKSKYKSGYHDSPKTGDHHHYRSSYELRAYLILDADPNVALYITEPCAIPYEFNGQAHRYIPDLYVEFSDGSWALIEIKPVFQLEDDETQLKHLAASIKFDEHFMIWSEQILSV